MCVKGFGVACAAFDAADTHEAEEGFGIKPEAFCLGGEVFHEVLGLSAGEEVGDFDVGVWSVEVAVELGDFVFEEGVVAPGIAGEFADDAVVLVEVVAIVGENEVGVEEAFEGFEFVLDLGLLGGKVAVAEGVEDDFLFAGALEELAGTALGLGVAEVVGTEDGPPDFGFRAQLQELEDGAAGADFDVVAVCAEAEQAEGAIGGGGEIECLHDNWSVGRLRGWS